MQSKKIFASFFLAVVTLVVSSVEAEEGIHAEYVRTHSGDGKYLSVSPDGSKFAVVLGKVITIIDSATGEVLADSSEANTAFDPRSFCWSPDSSLAVFTEDYYRLMRDSDVWILTIKDNALIRVFADDIQKPFRAEEGNSATNPVWSPDGKNLFVSCVDYASRSSVIRSITNLDESTAEVVFSETPENGPGIWSSMFPVGDSLYFCRHTPKKNDEGDGIFRVHLSNGHIETVLSPDETRGEPLLLAVSADGTYALAIHFLYAMSFTSTFFNEGTGVYESGVFLIDLSDYSKRPLEIWKSGDEVSRIITASFSPDGSQVVYLFQEGKDGHMLMIQDTKGGSPRVLFTNEGDNPLLFGYSALQYKPQLFWASDNRLFVLGNNGDALHEFTLIEGE